MIKEQNDKKVVKDSFDGYLSYDYFLLGTL